MADKAYNQKELSKRIKDKAIAMGFLACGISRADALHGAAEKLDEWLQKAYHADMGYMERNKDKRTDPRLLVDGAKSVISFLYNYFPGQELHKEEDYRISKYAYGKDYHFVIKKKLKEINKLLVEESNSVSYRVFVDSAPVMDKVWAAKSGLGWIGKNTCLLNRKFGSFFFIGEIITDTELEYDEQKHPDLCGSCTRCLRACPTGALTEPYVIDAGKCISYLTIEHKGDHLPENLKPNFRNWIFGCDICQDVCPWNRISKPHSEADFKPSAQLQQMNAPNWEQLTEEEFRKIFKGSAVKRTKYSGLKRNINFVKGNPDL